MRDRGEDVVYSDDRGSVECNGSCYGSHPNSPPSSVAAADVTDSSINVLWQHGVCKWPGCDTDCDNPAIFVRSSISQSVSHNIAENSFISAILPRHCYITASP